MQIIVVHPRLKRAVTLTLGRRHAVGAACVLGVVVAFATGLLSWAAVRWLPPSVLAVVSPVLEHAPGAHRGADDPYVRQNIDALATRLGLLQARLSRLDALGERVAEKAGIKPGDLPAAGGGRGGPLVPDTRSLSFADLSQAIESATRSADRRGDALVVLEDELRMRAVTRRLLPTSEPLPDGSAGSRFGRRVDPFTGRAAFHEGIDFNAPVGTPILAAGGGVVIAAGPHGSYGQHVDVDHGEGVVTRYAHASRLLVRVGDIVRQGQKLAEVGSTGRSSGPHLHFEVRIDDDPHDPMAFLDGELGLAKPTGRRGAMVARRGAVRDGEETSTH